MRESCKSSEASKARGSGVGKIPTGVDQRGVDDEVDKWGPRGGDRGMRRPAREGVI
jgi:hypothetical protein